MTTNMNMTCAAAEMPCAAAEMPCAAAEMPCVLSANALVAVLVILRACWLIGQCIGGASKFILKHRYENRLFLCILVQAVFVHFIIDTSTMTSADNMTCASNMTSADRERDMNIKAGVFLVVILRAYWLIGQCVDVTVQCILKRNYENRIFMIVLIPMMLAHYVL